MKMSKKAVNANAAGQGKYPRAAANKTAKPQQAKRAAGAARGRAEPTPERSAAVAVPRQSKQAAVIALLRRPEGVTVGEVASATGWQPHTVRGLFSGTLKKKLGLNLNSAQEQERGRVYRIIGAAAGGNDAGASA